MDSHTKSAIKSLVLDLRHTLEDELTIVLRRYGLFTDRERSLEEPLARLALIVRAKSDLPDEVWQTMQGSLSSHPDNRPASAAEVKWWFEFFNTGERL
jgi:hypothetical protein